MKATEPRREIEIVQKTFQRHRNRVMRDFREVQNLKTREAKEKVISKLKSILLKEISFDIIQETRQEVSECDIDTGWSLQVLDGDINMLTGIPLIMIHATLFVRNTAAFSLGYLPFMDEIILCETDKGIRLLDAMGRMNSTDKNPILGVNSDIKLPYDKVHLNADLIVVIFTAIGRIDGFVLKLDPWMEQIADFYMKEGGNKVIKFGPFSIGGSKNVQNMVKNELLAQV